MPNCLILAGPNGAGKTTAARLLLPQYLETLEFVNADHIAVGLSAFNPEGMAMQAGRLMLTRLRDLVATQQDFAFETTLATRIFAPMITEWRRAGYQVNLLYFYLPSPEQCIRRVAGRVAAGGHFIPNATVQRRWARSLRYLFDLYCNAVDEWSVFDNELRTLQPIASSEEIQNPGLWQRLKQQSLLG